MRTAALLSLLLFAAGCAKVRPDSDATCRELPRPVVVVGGIFDPGFNQSHVGRWLKENAGEGRVVGVSPGFALGFDGAAASVVETVERHFPSDDPDQTVEVDVIGVSMGGVTARHAAAPNGHVGKRLNVRRMFTIAAPHGGAQLANLIGPLSFGTARAMRTDSPFLRRLARRERATDEDDYELIAYGLERDLTIGPGAAPPAHFGHDKTYVRLGVAWYVPSSHNGAYRDKRILRDILRRLRED